MPDCRSAGSSHIQHHTLCGMPRIDRVTNDHHLLKQTRPSRNQPTKSKRTNPVTAKNSPGQCSSKEKVFKSPCQVVAIVVSTFKERQSNKHQSHYQMITVTSRGCMMHSAQTIQCGHITAPGILSSTPINPVAMSMGHHFLKAECTYVLCCLTVAAITGSRYEPSCD